MIENIAIRISTVSGRDLAKDLIHDVQEIPTMDGAERTAAEYRNRGGYIDPKYLLDVWLEAWNR